MIIIIFQYRRVCMIRRSIVHKPVYNAAGRGRSDVAGRRPQGVVLLPLRRREAPSRGRTMDGEEKARGGRRGR